ncbi:MAG: SRPBCC domain-containing protein [Chitinophagaceae bacterium]
MKNEQFTIERTFNAPVEKVWKAITDKDQMKLWYFDIADFKAESGFEFKFEAKSEDKSYLHLCKITEVIPGEKPSYSWRYEGYEGNSFVSFELFPEGDQTRLLLTHDGLETFPADVPDFARECFATGWTEIIGLNLKNFVETGMVIKSMEVSA